MLSFAEGFGGLVDKVVPRCPGVNELMVREELICYGSGIGRIEWSEEVL